MFFFLFFLFGVRAFVSVSVSVRCLRFAVHHAVGESFKQRTPTLKHMQDAFCFVFQGEVYSRK